MCDEVSTKGVQPRIHPRALLMNFLDIFTSFKNFDDR